MLRALSLGWLSAMSLPSLEAQQEAPREATQQVPQEEPLRWLATEHLGRLTPPRVLAPVGLAGTDLGVSFPSGERLVFLFGDSWTLDRRDWDVDSVAWTKLAPLENATVPSLQWFVRPGNRFLPLAPEGLQLGGMDVPVEGVVVGERTYVFFSSGWDKRTKRHSHSVLAHTADFATLQLDHRVTTGKFVNVSIVRDGAQLWIFGSGAYRKSSVFLARVEAEALADRAAWRYWPDFTPDEATARPLVASDCIGELSVRQLPGANLWAMTCNATTPRGIHLRTAHAVSGPWSEPVVIFDPGRDRGYGHCLHQKASAVGYDDGLSDPGREEEWGGEYGPYLVPEWCTSPEPGVSTLVYALSTWNPYTVQLVRSHVAAPGVAWKPAPTQLPPKPPKELRNLEFAGGRITGWQQEGETFATAKRADGSWLVTTYVKPSGDAVRGRLWQDFTVAPNARELRGFVHGGSEAVQLWRGDELLRCTRGRRTNDVETEFRWTLEEYRGEALRLVIADDSTAAWGFVSVRGLAVIE
ncbi:MAG TPA: DUF4185 domain-containing protein [Planctomycetota bacterium]|nr:DUF4185 domain-containing protein [Planctomycetota bacterium]